MKKYLMLVLFFVSTSVYALDTSLIETRYCGAPVPDTANCTNVIVP